MKALKKSLFRKNIYVLVAAIGMFILGWLINKYLVRTTSVIYYSRAIEDKIQDKEKDFEDLIKDTALLRSIVDGTYSEKTLSELLFEEKRYGLFVYDQDTTFDHQLRFWNTHLIKTGILWEERDTVALLGLSSGKFVHVNRTVTLSSGKKYTVDALIPVLTQYFVQNTNFTRQFAEYPGAEKLVDISLQPTDYPVKSLNGQILFYLAEIQPDGRQNNWWSFIFVLGGIFILIVYVHQEANYIYRLYGLWAGIGFMFITILVLRLATYYYPGFLNLRQFELFDPAIYSSSFLLSSLGDLLINSLLCSWLMLFINRRISSYPFRPFIEKWKNWATVIVLLSIMVSASFIFADILQSLVSDANGISFNVINIENLTRYSFIGFVILATLALSYFFLAQILLTICGKLIYRNYYFSLIISATMGLLILTFTENNSIAELNLYVLLWLLLFLMMIQQQLFSGLRFRLNVSEVLFWLFVFSFSIAAVIIFENRKIEFEDRIRFAEKLSQEADPSVGNLLSIAFAYLDNDFLYPNYERFKNPRESEYLKDSIVNKSFGPYVDRYDTKIYLYDDSYRPLQTNQPVSFDTLNTIFTVQSKKTDVNDVTYYEKSFDQVSYIIKKEVKDGDSAIVGYFFMVAEPKRYKSEALVPELFQGTKEMVPDYTQGYSYAIYVNRRLSRYYNDYPFPTYLEAAELPKTEFKIEKVKNYEVLWYKGSANSIIIIAKKNVSFLEAITLFSYLFTTFLFLLAFYRLGALIVRSRLSIPVLRSYWEFSIRSQIHSTIIMVSLLSFLVIGVATILFFINRYDRDQRDSLTRTIKIMVNELQNRFGNENTVINAMMLYSDSSTADLERLMGEITEIHGTDVNFYDTLGNLKVYSNQLIYQKGVFSEKMNPEAFFELRHMRAIQVVTEEKFGRTDFKSIYCPIRDKDGRAYAYLNVPSFRNQGELTQEISNFLVTVINLNAFIFLVAGAIALVITNRITSSFTIIGQKMRDINLNKINQEIQWKRKDEIGELVNEYNKMVRKLDESADALAKSEREGAWRQMARQVAHEIKNPLTPMKLSIQYLQKAIDNNSPNVKAMTGSVANTLIEQIDHLSKIASDFSQFANIGNPRNEVFDLHDLLSSLTLLYEATERLHFTWEKLDQRLMMMADKTQLNRLFTNLLQNAVEASEHKDEIIIIMKEELLGDDVIISVSDNGDGIPEHIQSKIFTPNFTTKSSGTGLGLAMSKSIAEQARGDIWFEITEGTGTTFYVKLPLHGQL